GRVAGGRRALRVEDGLQRGKPLVRAVAAHALVGSDLADGDDLVVEAPRVLRRRRALVRAQRPAILVLARDTELARDERGLLDHVPVVEARGEPVVRHQVDERAVAEPIAETRLL